MTLKGILFITNSLCPLCMGRAARDSRSDVFIFWVFLLVPKVSNWNFILSLLTCDVQNSHLKGQFISGELIYKSGAFLWSNFISWVYTHLDLVCSLQVDFLIFFLLIFFLFLALQMHLERTEVDFLLTFPTEEPLNKFWFVVPSWAPTYICGRTLKAQRKGVACENFSDGGCVWLRSNTEGALG